jgi:hypothetical protein
MLPLGIFRSRTLASANLVALTFLAGFTGLIVTGQQLGGVLGLALVTVVDATFTTSSILKAPGFQIVLMQ